MDLQHQFLGNCGNWSRYQRIERANGEGKWTGCSPLPTIWLNWFLLNNTVPMAGPWRYFPFLFVHWKSNIIFPYAQGFTLPSSSFFLKFFVWEQIMTPKAHEDIHINLPALHKLDSMLIVCSLCGPIKITCTTYAFILEIHPVAYLKLTGDTWFNG